MLNKTHLAPPPASSFRMMTDQERQMSLETTMSEHTTGDDVWVFGYGSLIWNPDFDFVEKRSALLRGYHRALCLWSRVNRGTPEHPGLVFALDNGGSCQGVVYKISASIVPETMQQLWRREMSADAYVPKWLNCSTPDGTVKALAFVMNHQNTSYVKSMPDDLLVKTIKTAVGTYGSTLDYVLETYRSLKEHNINDRRLKNVVELVCG